MKYNMLPCEKETHISWDAENRIAKIFTCDPLYLRKLDKLVQECPDEYSIISEKDWLGNRTCTYAVSAKLISFRKPSSRVMSEEHRLQAAERLRNLHKSKALQDT